MKLNKLFLLTTLFCLISFAQEAEDDAKKPKQTKTAFLKVATINNEKTIQQFVQAVEYYKQQRQKQTITDEEMKKFKLELYNNFLFVPGLTYQTVPEQLKIYLREEITSEEETSKDQNIIEIGDKKYRNILIRLLSSRKEIQSFQLKQQEGQNLKQQIDLLEKEKGKAKQLAQAKEKFAQYQNDMEKNFSIKHDKTYSIAINQLSVYILATYQGLKHLANFYTSLAKQQNQGK